MDRIKRYKPQLHLHLHYAVLGKWGDKTKLWLCACDVSLVPAQSIYPSVAAIDDSNNGDTNAALMCSFTTPLLLMPFGSTTRMCQVFFGNPFNEIKTTLTNFSLARRIPLPRSYSGCPASVVSRIVSQDASLETLIIFPRVPKISTPRHGRKSSQCTRPKPQDQRRVEEESSKYSAAFIRHPSAALDCECNCLCHIISRALQNSYESEVRDLEPIRRQIVGYL